MEVTGPPQRRRRSTKRTAETGSSAPPAPLLRSTSEHRRTLFPRLLAAHANIHLQDARSLIKRLLRSHLDLTKRDPHRPLPDGLLSILPPLLICKYGCVSILAAATIGALALSSLDTNAEVASDRGVLDGLLVAMEKWRKRRKKVAMASCNAVLDLLTGTIARERLSELRVIVRMLSQLCQVVTCMDIRSRSTDSHKKRSNDCSDEGTLKDKFTAMIFGMCLSLINSCTGDVLEKIPSELSRASVAMLKQVWIKSRCGNSSIEFNRDSGLVEAIFRLSMNDTQYSPFDIGVASRSFFGDEEADFERFLLEHWEGSPFLFKNLSRSIVFGSLGQSFNTETFEEILNTILPNTLSCSPIISDELDILSFLKEARGTLGSPMLYGQDIRLVKTQKASSRAEEDHSETEVHFYKKYESSADTNNPKPVYINDRQKLKQAFLEGYTIALRGMEFRYENFAAITEGLAALFGQPSVGANMYITPPRSQGLSRHYDDHCVFVCQIKGQKQWAAFDMQASLLPRLYEPLKRAHGLDANEKHSECNQFKLQRGDILYIPRGCPHEAHTFIDGDESQTKKSHGFSLHLTLAIEVEPPFEWEGFAHIGLHYWFEKHKETYIYNNNYYKLKIPKSIFVDLLHIAIQVIGNDEPFFRKACLVGACNSGMVRQREKFKSDQKAIFGHIIDAIKAKSIFLDTLKYVERNINEENDESFQRLRWLQHLPYKGNENRNSDFDMLLNVFEEFARLSNEDIQHAETVFMQIILNFCEEVVFEDVCEGFHRLLEKYRKTRKQYINGMLSLHCAHGS